VTGGPAGELGVVTPFWLDRPDTEALDIARAADAGGFAALWIGEMATFDAFALATAAGLATSRIRPVIGPLAAGVRDPVTMALGASSVATLIGREVDVALGASSPAIVSGWHDRPWPDPATRLAESARALRPLLAGERSGFAGTQVRTRGFRLRRPLPDARITLAAFGPASTRVAAELADRVVLNLVTPEHVARVRRRLDEHARAAGRRPPGLAVWVAAALDPGPEASGQLAGQLAAYLAPPGYGEMFTALGHGELVEAARAGARRAELAARIPPALVAAVCAVGSADEVAARLSEYHAAGAAHVGVVPATAGDPGGRRVLAALAPAPVAAR
jgi:probable F420-dependent oxidoreductase